MKHYPHHTFADLRDAIFAPPPAKRARGSRTDTWVSGNPDVKKEASARLRRDWTGADDDSRSALYASAP
jgi:hypothetical protein